MGTTDRTNGILLARAAMIVAVGLVLLLALAVPLLAWDEIVGPPYGLPGDLDTFCYEPCHTETIMSSTTIGPHGNFSTLTSKCDTCHTIHAGTPGGIQLLPGATIDAVCFTCHDGTAGRGVYGAIDARGETVGASHSIESTNVIPGGDPLTGGAATATLEGTGGTLTCTDCHSAHGNNIVEPYRSERVRNMFGTTYFTSKLLKRRTTSSETTVSVYGSDWCWSCHKGRSSGGAVHNHPVETSASAAPGAPYNYGNVAVLASDDPTSTTVMSGLVATGSTRRNRGFLMPSPRTPEQSGHMPICQQCHEDTRDAGQLVGDGSLGDATPTVITGEDGTVVSDNPRFQTFPHETVNAYMLIELDDDLCLNCHPVAALP